MEAKEEREVKNDDKTSVKYDSEMTSDKFFAAILSNLLTARLFFEFILPKRLLRRLDMATLDYLQPRLVAPDGKEHIGDFFFKVKFRARRGREFGSAIFVIVLEHKFEDELYVSIQLLRYTANLLGVMRANRKFFADENGLLPTPYSIVFSQEWQNRKTYFLRDVLRWVPGLRKTVPNFWYQHFRISEKKLEAIRECEPLLGLFLYLERLARKTTCEPKEERKEIAGFTYRCLTQVEKDPRIQDGTVACAKYLQYIRTFRPETPTTKDVLTEIEENTGMPMNFSSAFSLDEFTATVLPTFYESYRAAYDAAVSERDTFARKYDVVVNERDTFARKYDAVASERDAVASERDAVASERDAVASERDAVANERDALARMFRKQLLNCLTSTYKIAPSDEIYQKVASVNDSQTLERIQRACWNEDRDAAEIRKEIERIVADVPRD